MKREKAIAAVVLAAFFAVTGFFMLRWLGWEEDAACPPGLEASAEAYGDGEGEAAFGEVMSRGAAGWMPALRVYAEDIKATIYSNPNLPWSFELDILTSWDGGRKPIFAPEPVISELSFRLELDRDHVKPLVGWDEDGKNAYRCDYFTTRTAGHADKEVLMNAYYESDAAEPYTCTGTLTAEGEVQFGTRKVGFSITHELEFTVY